MACSNRERRIRYGWNTSSTTARSANLLRHWGKRNWSRRKPRRRQRPQPGPKRIRFPVGAARRQATCVGWGRSSLSPIGHLRRRIIAPWAPFAEHQDFRPGARKPRAERAGRISGSLRQRPPAWRRCWRCPRCRARSGPERRRWRGRSSHRRPPSSRRGSPATTAAGPQRTAACPP